MLNPPLVEVMSLVQQRPNSSLQAITARPSPMGFTEALRDHWRELHKLKTPKNNFIYSTLRDLLDETWRFLECMETISLTDIKNNVDWFAQMRKSILQKVGKYREMLSEIPWSSHGMTIQHCQY